MRRARLTPWILLIAALALAGCGDDNPGSGSNPLSDAGVDVGSDAGTDTDIDTGIDAAASCTPDPELIAEGRRCQVDDDCPCGTYCGLGQCVASCTSADECEDGQVCDDFGRCRGVDDEALVPAPEPQAQGRISLDRTRVLLEEGVEASVTVRVEERAIDRARLTASPGAELRCPDAADFAASCEVSDLEAGAAFDVVLRRDADAQITAEDVPVLTVYGPENTESATLPRLDQLPSRAGRDTTTPVALAGRYTGRMRLIGAGTDADLANLPEPAAPSVLQITAGVWDDGAGQITLAIDDSLDALTSAEQFIGTVALDADDDADGRVDGQATFVDHPFVDTTVAGRQHLLKAVTIQADVSSRLNPRTLDIVLTQSYHGFGSAVQPTVRWAIELQRSGETSAAAPSLPAPAALGYTPGQRLSDDSPWEAAFNATADTANANTRYFYMTLGIGDTNANICAADARTRDNIQEGAFTWWLSGGNGVSRLSQSPNFFDNILRQALFSSPNFDRVSDARVSAAPDTPPFEHVTPCQMHTLELDIIAQTGVTGTSTGSATVPGLGFCDRLQEATGCELVPLNDPFNATAIATVRTTGIFPTDLNGRVELSGVATMGCRFPIVAPTCGEQLSCLSPDSVENATEYAGAVFSQTKMEGVGDLQCANSDLSAGIALDRVADLTASDVFERCLGELEALADAPPQPTGKTGVGFNEIYAASPECVDVGRLLTALAVQGRTLRPGAFGLNEIAEASASAYTQRLLVRWLDLHGFFAAEGAELSKMAAVFEGQTLPGRPAIPNITDLLEASTRGWDLLLTPHVANSVYAMSDAALVEPDYRFHRFGLTGHPADEQQVALAEAILETLARQAELAERYVEQEGGLPAPGEPDPIAELMPRMLVAQTMAADMHRRAQAADPNLPWKDDYAAGASRASAKIAATLGRISALESGANPLGIEDADLPLYFLADDASGDGGRFSAISDFIAGNGPGSTAWAPALVAKAQAALTEARDAFLAESDRRVREARSDLDLGRWVEDVRDEYNATLRDYCGPLSYSLIDDPNFDAASCALNKADPQCSTDYALWYNRWTEDDLLGRMCLHHEMVNYSNASSHGFYAQDMRNFVKVCYADDAAPDTGVASTGACSDDPQAVCLRCDWKQGVDEVVLEGSTLELSVPEPTGGLSGIWLDATDTCRERYPQMRLNVPRPTNPLEVPGCVRGALGEAYLDVVAAAADVDAARQAIAEHNEAYDIAMESCFILQDATEEIQQARAAHSQNMQTLRVARAVADSIALAAGAVKECAANVADSDKSNPVSAAFSTAAAGTACVAGGVEAAANITSVALDTEMERAQSAHENMVANIEETAELEICFNDAKHELVGLKAATMDLEGAVFDMQRAQARVTEQIADAQRVHDDGHAYLKDIADWPMPDAAGDVWVNERVNRYVRDFQLARRATYLAVRAVEYEYQQSLAARQDVFEAKVPAELETILQNLWTAAGTRTINGNRPTELSAVVSLRDDILQLGDESAWPDEMRPMTVAQRFQLVLNSERYAVYNDEGEYTGQRIPFTLAPLEAFDFEAGGVPLYAQTDCAERLWSVNAGIVGQDVYRGSDTTVTRIDLLKRNSFFSQWCSEPADDEPAFQYASVRPSRNLFRQPGVGEPTGTNLDQQGIEAFSRARIQAFFGVDRATMEDPQYANGETSELAARGLYGDYALFIPAALISRDGGNGLRLEKVDDILLRVDYLSVARN